METFKKAEVQAPDQITGRVVCNTVVQTPTDSTTDWEGSDRILHTVYKLKTNIWFDCGKCNKLSSVTNLIKSFINEAPSFKVQTAFWTQKTNI